MERLQPQRQERRERTGIIQIVIIAAVLLVALYGGLRLLSSTYVTWELREHNRKVAIMKREDLANFDRRVQERRAQDARLKRMAEERRTLQKQFDDGKLRCINGQLFRKLDNGWENLPNKRCPQL